MIRRINVFSYIRRYEWLLAIGILVVAMFVLAKPAVPPDLNYKYQLDLRLQSYPLVAPTAGLVEWSTERVREVYRWNLTSTTVAQAAPEDKAGTTAALLPATFFIIIGCVAMILVWFSPRMRMAGVGLLVFVIAGSHLGAHPAAYVNLTSAPSVLIPNATVALVSKAEPGRTLGVEGAAQGRLKDMADRYFEQYVRFTEHRMGSAGKILAGPKRVWFGLSGLVYVLPFAIALSALAALVTLVQTLSWALLMLAPFGLALALMDGRAGLKVWDHVVVPWIASLVLLAVLGLVLPLVLYLATLVHAMESEIGLLLVGSVFPIVVVVGGALVLRRMRGGAHAHGRGTPAIDGPDDRTPVLASKGRTVRRLMSDRGRARK